MPTGIDTLDGLTAFVATVEAGSITAAARALGMPRETLGRQLARLEARLSVRLLHRTTRKLAPSQAGAELYDRARRIVADGLDAVERVRSLDGVPRGRLRITTPPNDANNAFSALVSTFLDAYPEVTVELLATARHVDLVAEGFDAAIRAGPVRDPSLVVRNLQRSRLGVVGSPAYLARKGTPATVADLERHLCLRGFDAGMMPVGRWPLRDGGSVPVGGRMAANDLPLLLRLAIDGLGLALLPEIAVRDALADGRLVPLLPEIGGEAQVAIVFPERAHLDPKVRAFVEHTAAFFAAIP